MKDYVKRLAELVAVTFLGAAVPVLVSGGLSKAAVSGAVTAGLVALYGLVVKNKGAADRPTVG